MKKIYKSKQKSKIYLFFTLIICGLGFGIVEKFKLPWTGYFIIVIMGALFDTFWYSYINKNKI